METQKLQRKVPKIHTTNVYILLRWIKVFNQVKRSALSLMEKVSNPKSHVTTICTLFFMILVAGVLKRL